MQLFQLFCQKYIFIFLNNFFSFSYVLLLSALKLYTITLHKFLWIVVLFLLVLLLFLSRIIRWQICENYFLFIAVGFWGLKKFHNMDFFLYFFIFLVLVCVFLVLNNVKMEKKQFFVRFLHCLWENTCSGVFIHIQK